MTEKELNKVINFIVNHEVYCNKEGSWIAYLRLLGEVKHDKDLKNKVIDGVIKKLFGNNKVSWLMRIAIKGYLKYNYGI